MGQDEILGAMRVLMMIRYHGVDWVTKNYGTDLRRGMELGLIRREDVNKAEEIYQDRLAKYTSYRIAKYGSATANQGVDEAERCLAFAAYDALDKIAHGLRSPFINQAVKRGLELGVISPEDVDEAVKKYIEYKLWR